MSTTDWSGESWERTSKNGSSQIEEIKQKIKDLPQFEFELEKHYHPPIFIYL